MKEELPIEQILKSIKHVILGKVNHNSNNNDVYELTQVAPSKEPKATLDDQEDNFFNEKEDRQQDLEDLNTHDTNHQHNVEQTEDVSFISQNTSEQIKEHLAALKNRINKPSSNTSKTLEELTIDIMHPYLTSWLDANLPTIVQNVVEQEIKKLVKDEKNLNR